MTTCPLLPMERHQDSYGDMSSLASATAPGSPGSSSKVTISRRSHKQSESRVLQKTGRPEMLNVTLDVTYAVK